jgi:hypothetical protein
MLQRASELMLWNDLRHGKWTWDLERGMLGASIGRVILLWITKVENNYATVADVNAYSFPVIMRVGKEMKISVAWHLFNSFFHYF